MEGYNEVMIMSLEGGKDRSLPTLGLSWNSGLVTHNV